MFTQDFVADVNNENIVNACQVDETYYMYPISSAFYLKVVEELNTAAQLLNGQAIDLKDSVEVFCLGSEEQ